MKYPLTLKSLNKLNDMKMIGIMTVLLYSATYANAQLKFKAIEKNNAFGAHTIVNETTGDVLPENLVPKSETIIHVANNILFTRPADSFKDPNGETLKKYRLVNGRITEMGSMPFLTYSRLSFFQNGSFVLFESAEHGGKDIKFYSSEFQLLHTIIPYSLGYAGIFYHNSGNVIVVGVNQVGENASKLISITSNGELLFEKPIDIIGINRVLSSDNFFSVYSYN